MKASIPQTLLKVRLTYQLSHGLVGYDILELTAIAERQLSKVSQEKNFVVVIERGIDTR